MHVAHSINGTCDLVQVHHRVEACRHPALQYHGGSRGRLELQGELRVGPQSRAGGGGDCVCDLDGDLGLLSNLEQGVPVVLAQVNDGPGHVSDALVVIEVRDDGLVAATRIGDTVVR